MEQQKLPRLTPAQLKAEVDYIEEITQRLSNPTPEMTRDLHEKMEPSFQKEESRQLIQSGRQVIQCRLTPAGRAGEC
jgi:tRNA U34 5-carboxymethylaminomethyl modifying GTPase MnmE/TrmE